MKLRIPFMAATALLLAADVGSAQVPAPARWTVTREMRIDAISENLVTFWNLAIGPAGEIALPQSSDRNVVVYDRSGKRVAVAGRGGQGPGEFERPIRDLGWIGDTLWVANGGTVRVPLFTRAGQFIRELTMGRPNVGTRGTDEGRATFSPVIPRFEVVTRGGGAMAAAGYGEQATGGGCPCVFNIAPDGTVRNLVGIDPPPVDSSFSISPTMWGTPPFAWQVQRDAAVDGARVGWLFATAADRAAQRFRVTVLSQRGDTVFNRTYAFDPVRIPADIRDSNIARRVRQGATIPGAAIPASAIPELRRRTPTYYSPYVSMGVFQGIRMGLDGTIWIGLRATAEGNPWLVLDSAGNPIGRVVLSAQTLLLEASRQNIWAGEDDSNDLRSVVRYAVRTGG